MKKLLQKEWKLAFHVTVALFWLLSAMVMIPSYPYYVICFYTILGLFFVCLTGRENNDLTYTLMLPVKKSDVVRARIAFAVMVEGIQLLAMVPFLWLRQAAGLGPNPVGMDANVALPGFCLLLFGLFNLMFFPAYFAAPHKVGKIFGFRSVWFFIAIVLLETLDHVLPFMRDCLDTPDPQYLPQKLIALALGLAAFCLMTWLSCRWSISRFEKLDV